MKLGGDTGAPGLLTSAGAPVKSGKEGSVSGRKLECPMAATTVYTSQLIATLYIAALAMVPILASLLCWGGTPPVA